MWMLPPRHLALDIETIAGDPSGAESWMRRVWEPNHTWKPETIGRRYIDAYEAKKDRLALLDEAPIISVAMQTETERRLVHWLDFNAVELLGTKLIRAGSEREMLMLVRDHLDAVTEETVIIGHNILGFDLRKLRHAMVRNKVRQPAWLSTRELTVFDSMREFSHFTLDDRKFVSLNEVLEVFGMASHKGAISGADVGPMYESKQFEELLTYAVADVATEYALFLRMTGQVADTSPEAATASKTATAA